MKKLIVLVTLIATASAFSQGKVNFNNYLTTAGIDAPITYAAGGPVTGGTRVDGTAVGVTTSGSLDFSGLYARAGLYGATNGTPEESLVLITPSVPFKGGVDAGKINPGAASTRTITGVPVGGAAVVQVRAWDAGATNILTEAAAKAAGTEFYSGRSALINIFPIGGTPGTPSPLVGLTAFSMTYVPEPSIIGLGILGALAGLFVFRRRN